MACSYNAVFLDLDGTLLNENSEVSEYSLEVLHELSKKNVQIVIATGRPIPSVRTLLAKARFPFSAITLNGTVLHTDPYQEAFKIHSLSKNIVDKVLTYALNEPLVKSIALDCADEWYATEIKKIATHFEGMYTTPPKPLACPYEGSDTVLNIVLEIEHEIPATVKKLTELFSEHLVATTYTGWPMIELAAKHRNKGQALCEICEILKIHPHATIAIGDAENDLEMIEQAGMGVAMENAIPAVKEKATHIAGPHFEDGAAKFLAKIFEVGPNH